MSLTNVPSFFLHGTPIGTSPVPPGGHEKRGGLDSATAGATAGMCLSPRGSYLTPGCRARGLALLPWLRPLASGAGNSSEAGSGTR